MLHPALTRALTTAHIGELHRAAARRHTSAGVPRVAHARHVAARPIAIVRSASTRLRGRRAPQADSMTPTEGRGPYASSFSNQWSANGSSLNGGTSPQPVER
jgi:hypothetical protein